MSDSFLWYATRGAGIVSQLMLTAVVCLGILTVVRWQRPGWPRFLTAGLHANVALLSVVFLVIHVVTAVVDPFTALGFGVAVVPFTGSYRPFWVGLGVVSMDLMAAIVVTSLLRARLGHRAWRSVHWLAYGAWPLALLHSVGSGTDAGAPWGLALNGLCVAAVAGALAWRIRAVRGARSEVASLLPQPARPAA
jgi:predicted ferric reductase